MNPTSILHVITVMKDNAFYVRGTKLVKLKVSHTRKQFIFCKENFLNIEEVCTEEVSVHGVVNKQSLVGGQRLKKCNCLKSSIPKMCLYKSVKLILHNSK